MSLSEQDLAAARRRLDDEHVAILAELKDLGASPDGSIEVSLDEGFADAAQTTSERSRVLSMVETLQERLTDVRAAIERVENGKYGDCERCGEPINPDRLEAVPSARLCIKDAREQ